MKKVIFIMIVMLVLSLYSFGFEVYGDEYFPFNFTKNEEPKGLVTEIVQTILAEIGIEKNIKIVDWSEISDRLENNEKMIIFSMVYNEDLVDDYTFIGPIFDIDHIEELNKDFVDSSFNSDEVFNLYILVSKKIDEKIINSFNESLTRYKKSKDYKLVVNRFLNENFYSENYGILEDGTLNDESSENLVYDEVEEEDTEDYSAEEDDSEE